ncbi:HutD family protein [uncultured Pseudomonas sp.]|uniref:HutD/Ves family protein n=1 Tax=uncultured Pseudomonas sp. TaxID=114707 RepID=UPI00262F1ED3|nr:HutD family protein [uncultured Pseudomonas sp.]
MSAIKTLRAADYPRMPWKNGGGSTLEIVKDAGKGLEGFGWRLSIADIAESGGFSAFNGYQRIITVLEGAGMQLEVDGVAARPLLPLDAFAFPGDSRVECRLLGGAIRDFNLIYAPARYAARLQWLSLDLPVQVYSSAAIVLLFSVADSLNVTLDGESCAALGQHDCLVLDAEAALREWQLAASAGGGCCMIELHRLTTG